MKEIPPELSHLEVQPQYVWPIWLRPLIISLCIMVPVMLGVIAWNIVIPPPPEPVVSEPVATPVVEQVTEALPTQFYSNKANLSFRIPAGWREIKVDDVVLPVGISNPRFLFLHEQLGCVIAGGDFDRGAADYVQTSFGGRVFSPISQFDGDWYTNQAYHAEPIQFSNHSRQYLAYEIRQTYNLDNVDIFLWQKNNTAVPDLCNQAFELVLESTQHHFSLLVLQNYYSGTMYIRTTNIGTASAETRLLFSKGDDGNTYEIVELPPGTGHGGQVFVREGNLYALSEFYGIDEQSHAGVIFIDPMRSTYEEIPLAPGGERVIAQYVTADTLYFLSASSSGFCTGYRESCLTDLYAFDFETSERRLLSSSITSAQLSGFDKNTGTLYLQRGWGDAGCLTNEVVAYQERIGLFANALSFTGCVDDPAFSSYEADFQQLSRRFDVPKSAVINYQAGTLVSSDVELPYTYSTFYFVQ